MMQISRLLGRKRRILYGTFMAWKFPVIYFNLKVGQFNGNDESDFLSRVIL